MKKTQNTTKFRLHKRNKNRERYDLEALILVEPDLKEFIRPNKYGDDSLDFSSPEAVRLLNKALLHHTYGVDSWEFPKENLCPPIPGRADYIHYVADLLTESNFGNIPKGDKISCLDIGTGASCIYPIIGVAEYGWRFIATDIDVKSLDNAKKIIQSNEMLKNNIGCRIQSNKNNFFKGILTKKDKIDITICNPPFHASIEEAENGTKRKNKNLANKSKDEAVLNFSGLSNELICEGGENQFIQNMILESEQFSKNCLWFTTLVSKQSNLKGIYKTLDEVDAKEIRTIPMGTGNKSTRIVAWSFVSLKEEKEWAKKWGAV